MKRIPLTKGQVALVDDEDYEELSRYKWHAWKSKHAKSYYAVRTSQKNGLKTTVRMHYQVIGSPPPGMMVDHANLNGIDNRRHNLRFATRSQNAANQSNTKKNTSGIRGVSWYKKTGKWYAQICVNKRVINLGYYTDIKLAILAYSVASKKYYGEFGRTK